MTFIPLYPAIAIARINAITAALPLNALAHYLIKTLINSRGSIPTETNGAKINLRFSSSVSFLFDRALSINCSTSDPFTTLSHGYFERFIRSTHLF